MKALVGLVSGTVFGVGLALSGMMDPARVRGFLDIFGEWDPTLAFVMAGAIAVMAVAWSIQRHVAAPAYAEGFDLPGTEKLTVRLIAGSALFGAGWGLGGLCPGPGIASLGTGPIGAAVFVVSMIVGFLLFRLFDRARG